MSGIRMLAVREKTRNKDNWMKSLFFLSTVFLTLKAVQFKSTFLDLLKTYSILLA